MYKQALARLIQPVRARHSSASRALSAVVCALLFATATLLGVSYTSSRGGAQRLCENSDSAVAQISPCTGPAGTVINLTLRRKLASPPATLLFKRVLTNGVPAQARAPVSGLTAASPAQLCTTGGGRWQVWLIDAAGHSQGVIGAFWPDCTGTPVANASGSGPRGSGGSGNRNGAGGGNSNSGGGGGGKGSSAGNKNDNEPVDGLRPIDPCLVGTWKATNVTADNPRITGGGDGFLVTFKKDGTETVDYSLMNPFQMGDDATTYRGSATARISIGNKTAKVMSVEKKGVVVNFSKLVPVPATPLPGLGFGGLGETTDNNRYACSGDSLEYQGSMARDQHANVTVKLTRRKG